MIERHLTKLRARDTISAEEEQVIRDSVVEMRDYPRRKIVVRRGEVLAHSTLLLDGHMCRCRDLQDGERQITELHVPGDFADLHAFTLKRLDHDLMTLTPCTVALVPHDRLRRMTEQYPHLTRVYWFTTMLDAAIHREWQVSLGRRPAIARMAHLFCELHMRLGIVGLTEGLSYSLSLTLAEIGECLGITVVHASRTLAELRRQELLDYRHRRVTIHDLDGLRRTAQFDPLYLYLGPRDV
jgi:CRP-like cAMP-binding protein